MDFIITDYGAIGDGKKLNTNTIQHVLDLCSKVGGGRVIIPSGTFLSGTLYLRSNTELHLSTPNSILLASPNNDDYNAADAFIQNSLILAEEMNGGHFIIGLEIENASITGVGVIDGNGKSFFTNELEFTKCDTYCFWPNGYTVVADKEKLRPGQMVAFVECSNIKIEHINLHNSPFWTLWLFGCDKVHIHGIKINNEPTILNSDGIDIDCCNNVIVSDCIISTGDDALTLRANFKRLKKNKTCENIIITNCILSSGGANAIRIGVGDGCIKNAIFTNLIFNNSVGGVHIQSKYSINGGDTTINGIRFCNILGTNIKIPLFINSGFDAKSSIENIYFDGFISDMQHTLAIIGNEFTTLNNLIFNNIEFSEIGRSKGVQHHKIDCSEYGTYSPSLDCALYVAHANNVSFNNFKLYRRSNNPEWRYGLILEDTATLNLQGGCNCYYN